MEFASSGVANGPDPMLGSRTVSEDASVEQLRDFSKTLPQIFADTSTGNDSESWRVNILQALEGLLHIANAVTTPSSRGAAALDALCSLLGLGSACPHQEVKACMLSGDTWRRVSSIFLNKSQKHKTKPLRRLLLTLFQLLQRQKTAELKNSLIGGVNTSLVSALCDFDNAVPIKPVLQLSEQLVAKGLLSAAHILKKYASSATNEIAETTEWAESTGFEHSRDVQTFIWTCLAWVQHPDCPAVVGRFLRAFIDSYSVDFEMPQSREQINLIWFDPVRLLLSRRADLLEAIENQILPPLLDQGSDDSSLLLQRFPIASILEGGAGQYDDSTIQLCLVVAKLKSNISLKAKSANNSTDLDDTKFGQNTLQRLSLGLLDFESPHTRILALSTVVTIIDRSKRLENDVDQRLRGCIPSFHQEANAKSRNEFISISRRLFSALLVNKDVFQLASAPPTPDLSQHIDPVTLRKASEWPRNGLSNAKSFVIWYAEFLVNELRPTASYQSHATALGILLGVIQNGSKHFVFDDKGIRLHGSQSNAPRLQEQLLRSLTDLLFDPFDEVRQVSSNILKILIVREVDTTSINGTTTVADYTSKAIGVGQDLFRQSARADYAEGVARLLELNFLAQGSNQSTRGQDAVMHSIQDDLERNILRATNNFDRAIQDAPLHGNLMALRLLIEHSTTSSPSQGPQCFRSLDFYSGLLSLCRCVWKIVMPVLCCDAPEGSDAFAAATEDAFTESKSKLSFSWRALKELSLLVNSIVSKISKDEKRTPSQGYSSLMYGLGDLTFEQLANLRHRGAFSTVSQTFASWCASCVQSSDTEVESFLKTFYQRTLDCIKQRATTLTRRSAGLPAMVIGILLALPDTQPSHEVLGALLDIAREPVQQYTDRAATNLPQVHALNCLKDIALDARLSASIEVHLEEQFDLAIGCLDSPVWAVKNCGLMLMKALLNRINGGTDTASNRTPSGSRRFSKMAYSKVPTLPENILTLLSPEAALKTNDNTASYAQKVFPALEIVERFGLPLTKRNDILRAILRYRSSPIWPVRDKAAKSLSFIIQQDQLVDEIDKLFSADWTSQNLFHGRILQVRWLIRRFEFVIFSAFNDIGSIIFRQVIYTAQILVELKVCPVIAGTAWDVAAELVESAARRKNTDASMLIYNMRHEWNDLSSYLPNAASPGQALLFSALARYQKAYNELVDLQSLSLESFSLCKPAFNSAQVVEQLRQSGHITSREFFSSAGDVRHIHMQIAWHRALSFGLQQTLDFNLRMAAVQAIRVYITKLKEHKLLVNVLLNRTHFRFFILLYDALNDDDEEIRSEAAKSVSIVIPAFELNLAIPSQQSAEICLSSSAARIRLLEMIKRVYSGVPELTSEAETRLLVPGTKASESDKTFWSNQSSSSVLDVLEDIINRPKVIFEEEKQNLFHDPLRDIDMWLEILCGAGDAIDHDWRKMQSDSRGSINRQLTAFFRNHNDGVLGYTSDADVFSMLYRLFTIMRISNTSSGAVEPLAKFEHLELKEAAEKANLHPLLMRRLDETMINDMKLG